MTELSFTSVVALSQISILPLPLLLIARLEGLLLILIVVSFTSVRSTIEIYPWSLILLE